MGSGMQSGISLNLTFGTFMCIYSIVIVKPRHNLKICHIQNILDVAMRQISKIFSIILSKNILYLFENLLFLRDFKMCQRSFFFRKTVILKSLSCGASHPEHYYN